ncbi:MAG TPA: hypothetical protein VJ801_05115 [Polyangia bacterium]|nr:hypothetical protein [Polyangia bacterium]
MSIHSLPHRLNGALLFTLVLAADVHAGSKEIHAVITDPYGHPLPGAGLYAEAYTQEGAYDFVFATAGEQGEVPPAGAPPLKIEWRSGAHLAYAVMERDKDPRLLFDRTGALDPAKLSFVLQDAHPLFPVSVAGLGYPFARQPALAKRAAAPEYSTMRALLNAFSREKGELLFSIEPQAQKTVNAQTQLFISANGRSVASSYIVGKDWHMNVNVNGKVHAGRKDMMHFLFSPDGSRWAVIYRYTRIRFRPSVESLRLVGETSFYGVDLDGKAYSTWSDHHKAGFSPDGKTFWAAGQDEDNRQRVVINGKTYQAAAPPWASEDGAHIGFAYQRETAFFAHLDDQDFGPFDSVGNAPTVDPTGGWWFTFKKSGKSFLCVNGRMIEGELQPNTSPEFSSDGKKAVLRLIRGKQQLVSVSGEGERLEPTDVHFLFHPDGTPAGAVREVDGKRFVEVNGRTFGPYTDCGSMVFSPDGSRFGFDCSDEQGFWINLNGNVFGVPTGGADRLNSLSFSLDATRAALTFTKGGKSFVMSDGRARKVAGEAREVGFSPDGRVIWFNSLAASKDDDSQWFLNVDDARSGPYRFQAKPTAFSKDGKHFWYTGEEFQLTVDGVRYHTASSRCPDRFQHTPDNSHWAFAYYDQEGDTCAIHIDGRPAVRILPLDSHGDTIPHTFTLLSDGTVALVTIDQEGAVRREILSGPSQASAPLIRLPKLDFVLGEPVPLEAEFLNDSARRVFREDPSHSPKTIVRIETTGSSPAQSLTYSLSGKWGGVSWNGSGPYPVPEVAIAPGTALHRTTDILGNILASHSPGSYRPGRYVCWVEDRRGRSNRLVFNVQYTQDSIPALLQILKDSKASSWRRQWAGGWLSRAAPPRWSGLFTGSMPWTFVSKTDVARAERDLKKNLGAFESWYRGAKDSDEIRKIIQGIQPGNE